MNNIEHSACQLRSRTGRCLRPLFYWIALITDFLMALMLPACRTTSSSPPSTPSIVVVVVQPESASLFLGQTQQFQASVTGTANTSVTWSMNGVTGGSTSIGTISAGGLYTASAVLPAATTVRIAAVSQAQAQASGSASVNLKNDIVVNVSPATATVSTDAAQVFTVALSASGNPATDVTWSVNGIAGGNSSFGTIVANGTNTAIYTAPFVPPSPATVSVTATSAADTSKSATASVTIICAASNPISPSATGVALGQTQTFTAPFCIPAGTAIGWDVNGVAGGNSSIDSISSTGANTAAYMAPSDLPSVNPLTVPATAQPAGGSVVTASATVALTSSASVSISPASASMALTERDSFLAAVTNTSHSAVSWSVKGTVNGNAAVGQICQPGSNPCVRPAGPVSGTVDYLAPAALPATSPVAPTATSRADASQSATALVAITGPAGPISVTVSPYYAFVVPSSRTVSTTQFFATVTGTANKRVTWTVQSAVAGQRCSGAACGSVDATGLYSTPTATPSPNTVSVIATCQTDGTKSGSATVVLTNGPTIEKIFPSSVAAGAVESFSVSVQGMNFVAARGSSASTILFNGTARSTPCAAATSCTTALNPSDVQSAGTITIQVQNPGSPGALSNPVTLVIVPFDVSQDVISLSTVQPVVAGKDITVTDPTTAAVSASINVDFIDYLTGGNTCGVQGSALVAVRPSAGSSQVSICVHGNGLDPAFTYVFTGPNDSPSGDIGVAASAVAGLFPNMIELDFQISSTTLPGVRTLFITTPNNDRAIATGVLEVK